MTEDPRAENADARLGEWLRDDPRTAVSAAYERFRSDVNRSVWRLMGPDQDRDDVVQQVFATVMGQAKRLRDVERVAAWVNGIAANTIFVELRRREIHRLFLCRSRPNERHADLLREVETRDLLFRVKRIVDRIPAKNRVVFLLHVVDRETFAEIARMLGYSVATAKRRYGAAYRRFHELLSRDPELSLLGGIGRVVGKPSGIGVTTRTADTRAQLPSMSRSNTSAAVREHA